MIMLPYNVHQPHHPLFQIYEQKELNGYLIEKWLTLQRDWRYIVTDVTHFILFS